MDDVRGAATRCRAPTRRWPTWSPTASTSARSPASTTSGSGGDYDGVDVMPVGLADVCGYPRLLDGARRPRLVRGGPDEARLAATSTGCCAEAEVVAAELRDTCGPSLAPDRGPRRAEPTMRPRERPARGRGAARRRRRAGRGRRRGPGACWSARSRTSGRSPEPALVGSGPAGDRLPMRVHAAAPRGVRHRRRRGGPAAGADRAATARSAPTASSLGFLNAHTEIDPGVLAEILGRGARLRLDLPPRGRLLHLHRPGLARTAPAARAGPGADRRLGPRGRPRVWTTCWPGPARTRSPGR